MNISAAREFVLKKLKINLSPTLYYHGLHHTLDIVKEVERIALAENITDSATILLLKTAAWYHDIGFILTYRGHEEEGCRFARETLPAFDYNEQQINLICGMIMATKVPQKPHTLLEKVLCDADLDYLGREDFEPIAESLFKELSERLLVKDRQIWNRMQIAFLESHNYWTDSENVLRNAAKLKNLEELRVGGNFE